MTDKDSPRHLSLLDRAHRRKAEALFDDMTGEEQAELLARLEADTAGGRPPSIRERNRQVREDRAKKQQRLDEGEQARKGRLQEAKRAKRPKPKTAAERMREMRSNRKPQPSAGQSKEELAHVRKAIAAEARARLAALEKAIERAAKADRRLSRITPNMAKIYVGVWARRRHLAVKLGRQPSMGEISTDYPEVGRPSRQAIHNRLKQVEILEASDVWRPFRHATA